MHSFERPMKTSSFQSSNTQTMVFFSAIYLILTLPSYLCEFEELFKWNVLDYNNMPTNKANDPNYFTNINNCPFGVARVRNKLFVGVPRRRPGVPATLNIINLTKVFGNKSPALEGYPNYQINDISDLSRATDTRIVSVYRPASDSCGRLWFVDTGVLEYSGNRTALQRPSIWVIDAFTDTFIRRFEIPAEIVQFGHGLISITVDVDTCSKTFAYISDIFTYSLIVYSFERNVAWRFLHNYFYLDPLQGDFNVGGIKFMWKDGIYSIALGPKQPNGFKTAYFHSVSSLTEFQVSTEILRNSSLSLRAYHNNDFKVTGTFEDQCQSSIHVIDPKTGVMFLNQIQKNGIACWNTNQSIQGRIYTSVVQRDDEKMIYPSHLHLDQENRLWITTNHAPKFFYIGLDPSIVNFRIWTTSVSDAIKSGKCLGKQ